MPRHSFDQPKPPIENFVVPELAPEDDEPYVASEVAQPVTQEVSPLAFEVPGLVPDEEPVEVAPLESTSPGVLGFAIPKAKPQAPTREASTQYAYGSQRREIIEHFTDLAAQAEHNRQDQVAQYGLARHALGATGHHPPAPPSAVDRTSGFYTMEN